MLISNYRIKETKQRKNKKLTTGIDTLSFQAIARRVSLNICMITPTYFPVMGGTEDFIFNLSNRLARGGHRVTIVTPTTYQKPHDLTEFVEETTGEIPRSEKNVELVRFSFTNVKGCVFLTQGCNCFAKIVSAHKRQRFDIIHQFHIIPLGAVAVSLKRILRLPLVTTLMGLDSFSLNPSTFYRLSRPLVSFVMNASDIVTSPSRDLALHAYDDGCRKEIQVVPHVVDSDRFDPFRLEVSARALRARLGISPSERMILTVCRLVSMKKVETVVRAAPRVLGRYHNARFVVVGSGPEYGRLVSLARELHVAQHFVFAGRARTQDVPSYYAAADLFVLPSTYETFGLVVLEAMAAGKPVIASNVGAIRELVIDRETGFLFPPGHADYLADLILRILEDEELAGRMGIKGLERSERYFNWEQAKTRYCEIYSRLA